jgi:hypothetical protein
MNEKILKRNIIRLVINIFKSSSYIYSDILSLLNLEFELAKVSIGFLFISSLILLILISTAWLFLMGSFTVFLHSLSLSWVLAFIIIFIFNIFLVILLLIVILNLCKNLTFSSTRRQLSSLQKKV